MANPLRICLNKPTNKFYGLPPLRALLKETGKFTLTPGAKSLRFTKTDVNTKNYIDSVCSFVYRCGCSINKKA